jgi:steroid delta-isomerase-like uncharacterized protein
MPTSTDFATSLNAYLDGWRMRANEAILAEVTDDFVWDETPMAMAEPVRGKAQFGGYLTVLATAFPDFALTPTKVFIGEREACAEWTFAGTHRGEFAGIPATNKRAEIRGASVILWREGGICEERLYYDAADLLRQLGLVN